MLNVREALARSQGGREKIFLNYIPRNIFVNERDITVKVHIFLCTYFEFSAAYSQVIFSTTKATLQEEACNAAR